MSDIEWCDRVWNPVVGCSRVSAGCVNCYAEKVAHRGMSPQHRGLTVLGKAGIRWTGEVRFLPDRLGEPLRWRKPVRVFVNSMSDLFHEKLTNEQIAAVFGVMALAKRHTFQVLTKRAQRMREWFAWAERHGAGYDLLRGEMPNGLLACAWEACSGDAWGETEPPMEATPSPEVFGHAWPLPNVWLGVSAEDQAAADERIPELLDTPAAVRWVSYEPALGPIDFEPWLHDSTCLEFPHECICSEPRESHLNWIVVGGESGPGARPFDVAWARKTIEQCRAADVPCFVKQWGARPFYRSPIAPTSPENDSLDIVLTDRKGGDMEEWDEDLRVREYPQPAKARSKA